MKKKLIVLGMAGALLFSGLSVSAAANDCRHPSYTTYVDTETRYFKQCREHSDCIVYGVYKVEATVCHYCQRTINMQAILTGYKHVHN